LAALAERSEELGDTIKEAIMEGSRELEELAPELAPGGGA
jgi:hypothetical protein